MRTVVNAAQVRAARALLGIDQHTLARAAGVGSMTIKRLETPRDEVRAHVRTVEKVTKALEDAGVVFIGADSQGGPGVRLRDT